jgi:glycine reductase
MPLVQVYHPIKKIKFSSESSLSNHVLSINRREIEAITENDPRVRITATEIAEPGQAVRISPVLDVVEPRAKDNPSQTAFPGITNGQDGCGTGKTHILSGASVIGVGELPGIQEGLVDMSEMAKPFCPFAHTYNLILEFQPQEGFDRVTADEAIRESVIKVAEYLGSLARGLSSDQTLKIEWPLPPCDKPRCGLVYLVQSHGDLRRTYYRGQPLDEHMPVTIEPKTVLDSAIVSGNFVMPCNKTCTYIHQNHPLIKEMFLHHGPAVNFAGIILANEMSRLEEKKKVAEKIVQIAKELELAGVVINQEGGANTLTDVMMLCRSLEKENIQTTLILNEFAGADGTTPSLAETTAEATHIVSTGNNDHCITLPSAEKLLGPDTFPGIDGSLKDKITVPLTRIHSSTNQLGYNYLTCSQNGLNPRTKISTDDRPLRVVHYLNQFFGQIGGEEKAHAKLQIKEGPVGPGMAFKMLLGEKAEVVATIICGDNTMGENLDSTSEAVAEMAEKYSPDLFIAGPCFLAGRYGMACGAVSKAVGSRLSIPTVVGIAEANPGVDVYRSYTHMVPCGVSAAKMKQAAESMVEVALCLTEGVLPPEGSYLPQKVRNLVTVEKSGATRAVEMLVAKLNNQDPETELPLPKFDRVDPATPISDLKNATIVLGTEGGLTPTENPDRIEMSMATKFGVYTIEGLSGLNSESYAVAHGGYDNSLAQQDPNRLLPLDVMRELHSEGVIGEVGDVFYTTAGNATSVENATKFGQEIAEDIRRRFKQNVGVVFTST